MALPQATVARRGREATAGGARAEGRAGAAARARPAAAGGVARGGRSWAAAVASLVDEGRRTVLGLVLRPARTTLARFRAAKSALRLLASP